MWSEVGQVQWPQNIPGNEWWIQLLIDRGNGSTKIILKHLCILRANAVRRCTVIGMLDRAKDSYCAVQLAFGEIFRQFNEILAGRVTINVPFCPRASLSGNVVFLENGQPVPARVLPINPCRGHALRPGLGYYRLHYMPCSGHATRAGLGYVEWSLKTGGCSDAG